MRYAILVVLALASVAMGQGGLPSNFQISGGNSTGNSLYAKLWGIYDSQSNIPGPMYTFTGNTTFSGVKLWTMFNATRGTNGSQEFDGSAYYGGGGGGFNRNPADYQAMASASMAYFLEFHRDTTTNGWQAKKVLSRWNGVFTAAEAASWNDGAPEAGSGVMSLHGVAQNIYTVLNTLGTTVTSIQTLANTYLPGITQTRDSVNVVASRLLTTNGYLASIVEATQLTQGKVYALFDVVNSWDTAIRTTIPSKLTSIEGKLTSIDTKLSNISEKMDVVVSSVDANTIAVLDMQSIMYLLYYDGVLTIRDNLREWTGYNDFGNWATFMQKWTSQDEWLRETLGGMGGKSPNVPEVRVGEDVNVPTELVDPALKNRVQSYGSMFEVTFPYGTGDGPPTWHISLDVRALTQIGFTQFSHWNFSIDFSTIAPVQPYIRAFVLFWVYWQAALIVWRELERK